MREAKLHSYLSDFHVSQPFQCDPNQQLTNPADPPVHQIFHQSLLSSLNCVAEKNLEPSYSV